MPELPEVTTMVSGLRKTALKAVILDIWSDSKKNIKHPSFADFKKALIGARILRIERRGKLILFYLSNKKVLLVHPKMSGHFLFGKWERTEDGWKPQGQGAMEDPMNRFIHLIFFLDKGMLAFSDLRKFARIELWDKSELGKAEILKGIGPDALKITFKEFEEILKNKRKIKQVLMDQKLIAGIGNIYSDEILFMAKINPFRAANSLKPKEKKVLLGALKKVLEKGVELSGSSISDFRKLDGRRGGFQDIVSVYQKKECENCGGPITRRKLGGRTAHFCEKCQK